MRKGKASGRAALLLYNLKYSPPLSRGPQISPRSFQIIGTSSVSSTAVTSHAKPDPNHWYLSGAATQAITSASSLRMATRQHRAVSKHWFDSWSGQITALSTRSVYRLPATIFYHPPAPPQPLGTGCAPTSTYLCQKVTCKTA